MTSYAPITSGAQTRWSAGLESALAMTSGPMPAGSPIVMPSHGSCFRVLDWDFIRSPAVQVDRVSYIKDCADREQPGPPLTGPGGLQEQTPRRRHRQDHRQKRRWRERPFCPDQSYGHGDGSLEDHRACHVPDSQPVLLLIKPEKAVGHL